MKIDIIYLLYLVQNLSPILGFIAYFLIIDDVPRHNHLIFAYLSISFFSDGFTYFQMLPAPIIFNIHDICQFFIVIVIYVKLYKQSGVFFLAGTILVYITGIIATITMIGLKVYHNHMWALSGLLLSLVCIVYLCLPVLKPNEFTKGKNSYNIVVMTGSLLFYCLATSPIFLFAEWIFKEMSPERVGLVWTYHNVIGLIKNIGLTIAIFLTGKATAYEPSRVRQQT